jgi:hypothetical protein
MKLGSRGARFRRDTLPKVLDRLLAPLFFALDFARGSQAVPGPVSTY